MGYLAQIEIVLIRPKITYHTRCGLVNLFGGGSGLFDKLLVMADRTGDRKGRPYRCVPRMRPMTDRTGDHTGDRKGRPYRRVPRMRPMTDRTGDHKGDRKGRPYRRVPRMRP
jgi:hypothetical protein